MKWILRILDYLLFVIIIPIIVVQIVVIISPDVFIVEMHEAHLITM